MSWDEYINSGIAAVRRCDSSAAEDAFRQALKFAKHNFEREDSRLALTLSLLGHMYFHSGDFQRAEMLLEQSLRLHAQSQTLNEPCVLMDLFSLGEIKVARGHRVEACRLYEQTLERLKSETEVADSAVIEQAVEEFEKLLKRNLAMLSYTERLELVQPELIQSILAAAAAVGDVDTVEEEPSEEETAIAQYDTADGAESEHTGEADQSSLIELWSQQLLTGTEALAEDEQEAWVKAYLNLESALRLAQKTFPSEDQRLIRTIKALADASAKLNMFEQAEALYRETIAAARRAKDLDPVHVTALRLNLAVFYTNFDQFRQAKKIFDDVKVTAEIVESQFASTISERLDKASTQIGIYENVQVLLRQAQTAEEANDLDKAAKLANTALSTLRQAFAPNHPEHARVLRYRSQLLLNLGQTPQAEELAKRAERIERANDASSEKWLKIVEDLPRPAIQGVAV